MSRQRDYQKQMRFEGRCIICGAEAAVSHRKGNDTGRSAHCPFHQSLRREGQRVKQRSKRRNLSARSYKEIHDESETSDTNDG